MRADSMASLYALRELVDPGNVLARAVINAQVESGEDVTPLFFSRLQLAWRDGHLSQDEQAFCDQMQIDPAVYVKMRATMAPKVAGDTPAFQRVKEIVFDL
jgi:hypothetical protein